MTDFDGYGDLPSCVVVENWRESTVVVSCAGVIDMLTAPHLDERLTVVLDKKPTALIVDLTDVEFLASHGMNILVMVRRRIGPEVGFAVVADGPATSRPLKLIGLAELVNMCPTLDEAFDKVGGAPTA
ncbi:STAS domain-containing protein [Mycolicibacterium mengxianglii]|uniref:STAS domain-containing protein n=1 Tax=Mycolicibacterium mengxianglii TaxID=2736649 RepID=UPI001E568ED6|nr:STAS domain-containing protein [Mycolicibacterium mengxianglii]